MSLVRVDDRLIHGQVVVGWGRAMKVQRIVLVDDAISQSDWEMDLYRVGVPAGMEVLFHSVSEAAGLMGEWDKSPERTIVLVGNIDTLVRLCEIAPEIDRVNLGGVHAREGRTERLPYVFLSEQEAEDLRSLARRNIDVTARDVPGARPVPLEALL